MDKSLYEFGKEMSHFMPKFLSALMKKQAKTLITPEVTIPQMISLSILKAEGRLKMSQIAKNLGVTTSAATGLIGRMIKSNLVKRIMDKKDRRIINIEMSDNGRRRIDNIQKERYKMMMDIFGKFKPIERKRYLDTIKKIYRILTEEGK